MGFQTGLLRGGAVLDYFREVLAAMGTAFPVKRIGEPETPLAETRKSRVRPERKPASRVHRSQPINIYWGSATYLG